MAEKRRKTTAPLTERDVAEELGEIEPEEFLERLDEIFAGGAAGAAIEELASLDDYMERELREMFRSIVAQYLGPVGRAVERVVAGEQTKRVAGEGADAIAPILSAAESLKYEEVAGLLREIERPLGELREGARRRLAKRETAALSEAWGRLAELLRLEAEGAPAPERAGVSLDALARHLDGVTPEHVRSLRGAGLATLDRIAGAPAGDLAGVTGIPRDVAERIRAFAAGAVAAEAGARLGTQPGWMRVRVDSDVLKARLTFDYTALGRYLEPLLARLGELDAGPKPAPKRRAAAPRGGEKGRAR